MTGDFRPGGKAVLQRGLTISLWVVFVGAGILLVLNVYGIGLDFVIAGVRIRSTHAFRPAMAAIASWVTLGRLNPRLRLSRDMLLIVACLAVYAYTYHVPASRDVYPSEYTALSIATGRGTSLDGYSELIEDGIPYFIQETRLGLRSNYPLGPALVAWPVYVLAPLSKMDRPALVHRLGATAAILLGLAALWLVLGIARKLDPPFSPRLLALAYALGTTHWSTSASALWQHGPGEIWVLGALERLLDDETPLARRLLALGACMTLAVLTRPSLAISAALITILAIHRYRMRTVTAFIGAAILALPLLVYHFQTYGSILGAYVSQKGTLTIQPFGVWVDSAFWLMASPSRGVLWYEPVVFLTLLVALFRLPRVQGVTLAAGLAGFASMLAVYAHWPLWWGGYSFGPRLLTDALPWWVLAVASMGKAGPWFRNVTVLLALVGALVNAVGTTGNPVMWDDRPSVNWFPDRLKSVGDSQLVTAFLVIASESAHQAAHADTHGEMEQALYLWREEWRRRPWHRFAAFRVADLLIRTDRLDEFQAHTDMLNSRWPDSSYVRHLKQRMSHIIHLLDSPDWKKPERARTSSNLASAVTVMDSRLSTQWSTKRPQKVGDWLELVPESDTLVRGVAIVSAPEFGHGPKGVEVYGTRPSGRRIFLGRIKSILMPRKGWHVLRFDAVRLQSIRMTLTERAANPWSVSEARLITVEGEGTDELSGTRRGKRISSTPGGDAATQRWSQKRSQGNSGGYS